MSWARGKKLWRVEREWDRVTFTDECKVMIGKSNRVYVWRRHARMPDCLCPGPPVNVDKNI